MIRHLPILLAAALLTVSAAARGEAIPAGRMIAVDSKTVYSIDPATGDTRILVWGQTGLSDVAFDPVADAAFVVKQEGGVSSILKMTGDGAGGFQLAPFLTGLNNTKALAVSPNGDLYFHQSGLPVDLWRSDLAGNVTKLTNGPSGYLFTPQHMDLSPDGARLYVSTNLNGDVDYLALPGNAMAHLNTDVPWAAGLDVAADGTVFVAEGGPGSTFRVSTITPAGVKGTYVEQAWMQTGGAWGDIEYIDATHTLVVAKDDLFAIYDDLGVRPLYQGRLNLTGLDYVPVPEPSTFVLLGMGAIGLLGFAWRRGKRLVRCATLGGSLLLSLAAGLAQAVTIETVPVGNPNNDPDTRYATPGYGSVDHVYNIGKYEVTAGQYTEFLKAVASTTDTYGLYHSSMWSSIYGCKIRQMQVSDGFTYSVTPDYADRPVNYVSFWDAARFANWLHNGQPSGLQGPGTTERGAYTLDGYNSIGGTTIAKNDAAQWWIPSEDEWYKAAYHKNDGPTGNYWEYPTKTALGSPPGQDMTEATNLGNNANVYGTTYPIDGTHYTTVKGEFEASDSAYHTFDQGGNVWEWNATVGSTYLRGVRGGSFDNGSGYLRATHREGEYPMHADPWLGFRVAQVPEPSTFVLLGMGAAGLLGFAWRRRKRTTA